MCLPSLLLELVQYFVPVLCPPNSLPLLAASHRSLLKTMLRLSLPLLAHRGGLPVWHCIIRVPASIVVLGRPAGQVFARSQGGGKGGCRASAGRQCRALRYSRAWLSLSVVPRWAHGRPKRAGLSGLCRGPWRRLPPTIGLGISSIEPPL